jgi:hypothetical protein
MNAIKTGNYVIDTNKINNNLITKTLASKIIQNELVPAECEFYQPNNTKL